ncbi:MAG: hypothetical protein JXQ71_07525 [Verrucomicrobia bacterium]|nr:hypothetical protein [Verrucomicrobiota bacterium]
MNLTPTPRRSAAGNTLLLSLVIAGIIGFVLIAYLNLVRAQNMSTMRSQAWNAAIPVIEAGVEDALAHLGAHAGDSLECDGWWWGGTSYHMFRRVSDHFYLVTITNYFPGIHTNQPIIESRGYVCLPTLVASLASGPLLATASTTPSRNYLGRGVRVRTRQDRLFTKGLVARDTIDMNGNNILTDSFNSTDSTASTDGRYDVLKRRDNGDVATNSSLTNSLNVGNATIFGHVATGPKGSVAVGVQGAVGDLAWHAAKNRGVQDGHYSDDMNVSFPDVKTPFGGAFSPGGGDITNADGTVTHYDYILDSDNYVLENLSGKTYVRGDARLLVTGSIAMAGLDVLVVATNQSLELYMAGANADLGGNGVVNLTGSATNFAYYGLPSNTSLSMSGNGELIGMFYAPNADLVLNGGGKTITDFTGAAIARTALLNGHFNFHYDEALLDYGPMRGYMVTDWDEMPPAEVGKTIITLNW